MTGSVFPYMAINYIFQVNGWSDFPYIAIRCIFQVWTGLLSHTCRANCIFQVWTGLFSHTLSDVYFRLGVFPTHCYQLYVPGAGLACLPIQVVSTVYFRCRTGLFSHTSTIYTILTTFDLHQTSSLYKLSLCKTFAVGLMNIVVLLCFNIFNCTLWNEWYTLHFKLK